MFDGFYGGVSEHRVTAIAGGVAYFALLALPPFLTAIVALYGLIGDPATVVSYVKQFEIFLPGGAINILEDQLRRLTGQAPARLGLAFAAGVAVSIWSSNAGMKALFDALNVVYGVKEQRGIVRLNLTSLAFTAGAIAFMTLSLLLVAVLPRALQWIAASDSVKEFVSLLRWPVLFAALLLGLSLVYRWGPYRPKAQWHWITVGSFTACLIWTLGSVVFSWYVANFGNYNRTYGSLGAVIGFMTWLWLSSLVILAGAELDAVMERLDRGRAS